VTLAIVVSDTSPIRALQHLNLAAVLGKLYGQVYLPEQVAAELRRPQRRFPAFDPGGFPFFVVQAVRDRQRLAELRAKRLDDGEIEAILLALEKSASLILVDERIGRRVAVELGLRAVGVLGVLLHAKQQALIPAIRPLMARLQNEIDFHLSAALIEEVLRIADE